MPTYIIEHLEPSLSEWCKIEYTHISKIVGKENLWITNLKDSSLKNIAKISQESISKIDLKNKKVCVLDPQSPIQLSPEEAKEFDFFIFGGILGNYPPEARTAPLLTSKLRNIEVRNLGKDQMATDNAVYITKKIVDGVNLNKIRFINTAKIKINSILTTELPYKYVNIKGKPLISPELLKYIKQKDSEL